MKTRLTQWVVRLAVGLLAAAPACAGVFGPQRTAVFLLDYLNDGNEQPAEAFRSAFFEADNSYAAFIREASLGQADLVGDVFGWYHLPADHLASGYWPSEQEVFQVARNDVNDFRAYEKYVFVVRRSLVDEGGVSTFGPILFHTPDGDVQATRCTLWTFLYPVPTVDGTLNSSITHELIHSFGVRGHANAFDAGASFSTTDLNVSQQYGYGDPFDIMGGRWWAAHPNAAFKRNIGWLSEDQEIVSENSGVHVLYPQEIPGPGAKLITIPLAQAIPVTNGVAMSRYYVEYRTPVGFDETLSALQNGRFGAPRPVNTEGLLVRGGMMSEGHLTSTWLLDATPESLPAEYGRTGDFIDAFLLPGRFVYDPYNGIRITCGERRADGGIEVGVKHLPDLEILGAVITPIPGRWYSRARLTIRNRYPWNHPALAPGQRYIYVAYEGLVWDAGTGEYRRPRVKPDWNTVTAIMGSALTDLMTRGEATVNLYVSNPVNDSFDALVFMVDPQFNDFYGVTGRVEEGDDANNRFIVSVQ
ncbi:MAG: hypothetical protein KJ726_10030 [Verrucomicrobia bacterium]|nr:hypothetical protein [Verrucomicrobiota bacterium]MBU1910374.1 hypothetical protein [Verrucomicrobiota bacterium]